MSKATLDFNHPGLPTDEEDEDVLAAIDRGIADAAAGCTVSLDEARKLIPEWISKYESQNKR